MSTAKKALQWCRRLKDSILGPGYISIDRSLEHINENLGINQQHKHKRARSHLITHRAENIPCALYYAPTMDGQAEPGEVVWLDVNGCSEAKSILVIGRTKRSLLGQLITPNPDLSQSYDWMDIGSGVWDKEGRTCWLRLDKIIEVSESGIQRRGATLSPHLFERIASHMREKYGWS